MFLIIVRNKFLTIPSKFLHVKCAEIDLEDLDKFLMPSNFILIHILKSDSTDLIHKLYCTFSESYKIFFISCKVEMISLVILFLLGVSDAAQNGTQRSCAGTAGETCVFPFDYYGTVYYACVQEESEYLDPWCATHVDSEGSYTGDWAECNSECPVCETTSRNIIIYIDIVLKIVFRSCL